MRISSKTQRRGGQRRDSSQAPLLLKGDGMPVLLIAMLALLSASVGPTIVEDVEYYDVAGSTSEQVRASLEKVRPLGRRGVRADALTSMDVSWQFQLAKGEGGCAVVSLATKLNAVITLPRWTDRQAGTSLTERWDRYSNALKRHEEGHMEIGREGVAALHKRLSALTAPSCKQLAQLIEATGHEALDALEEQNLAYDRETKHGVLQGVAWP